MRREKLRTFAATILLGCTQAFHTMQVQKVKRFSTGLNMQASRRQLLSSCMAGISFACIQGVYNADATMMSLPEDSDAKLFSDSAALGKDKALERFKMARNDLNYLLENFSVISEGGGDNIRRYLGTVGVTSGMYGIPRVMKELQEEANDIVEYTENMNDFDAYLRQADTSCYSANFVEFSAAKTKPEKFFQDAKSDEDPNGCNGSGAWALTLMKHSEGP